MAKTIKSFGSSGINWPDPQQLKDEIEKLMGTTHTGASDSTYPYDGYGYRDTQWDDLYNGSYRRQQRDRSHELEVYIRRLMSKLEEDKRENDTRMKRIEERLFILEDPGNEAHESLKEAYNHYKMLEALILGTDNGN
jgi:hypothetical protein